MIADVIHDDTGLPDEQSRLLAVSLVGMAQVSARFWLADGRRASPSEDAATLVAGLAWRGIRGYPRTDEQRTDPPTRTSARHHRRSSDGGQDRRAERHPRARHRHRRVDAEDVEKLVAEALAGERRARPSPTPRAARSSSPATSSPTSRSATGVTGQVGFRS